MKRWLALFSVIAGLLFFAPLSFGASDPMLTVEEVQISPRVQSIPGCNFKELLDNLGLVIVKHGVKGEREWFRIESSGFHGTRLRIKMNDCILTKSEKTESNYFGAGEYKFSTYKFLLDRFGYRILFGVTSDNVEQSITVIVDVRLSLRWSENSELQERLHTLGGPITLEGELVLESYGEGNFASDARLFPKKPGDILYLEIEVRPEILNGQRVRD